MNDNQMINDDTYLLSKEVFNSEIYSISIRDLFASIAILCRFQSKSLPTCNYYVPTIIIKIFAML